MFRVFLIIIIFLISTISVNALQIIPGDSIITTKNSDSQDDNYSQADSILIVPLYLESEVYINDQDWYRAIFYYLNNKLHLGSFMFHYFVFSDGSIVEGNEKGEDQRLIIFEETTKPIVIAYLGQKDDIDFTLQAKESINELILDIANRQHISPEQTDVKKIVFYASEGEAVKPKVDIIGGRWKRTIEDIIKEITPKYSPIEKVYSLTVDKVELPSQSVQYGDNVIVKLTITNSSKYALFAGSDFEILASKTTGDLSRFYVNEDWLSLTQAPLMEEGSVLQPGESKIFQLRCNVPLYFGEQKEEFELINSLGIPYPNTKFTITLNITKSDKEVIEILETEIGYLNVRSYASGSADPISRVSPGQRFIVLERTASGWVKIDLGDSKSGWVAQQYTKTVN